MCGRDAEKAPERILSAAPAVQIPSLQSSLNSYNFILTVFILFISSEVNVPTCFEHGKVWKKYEKNVNILLTKLDKYSSVYIDIIFKCKGEM